MNSLIDNIRIPRRPWGESLLSTNARLMRGTSLGNTKKHVENYSLGTGKPKQAYSIKCFKVLELISDLKARGIPVLNKNAKKKCDRSDRSDREGWIGTATCTRHAHKLFTLYYLQ